MGESSRTLAKKAGGAAVERTLASLMPELFRRLDRLDERMASFDRELHGLREHIDARFEQSREVANQLGERMARVEGRFCHGNVIHFGGPVGKITRVIGFDAFELEGGDQFQKNGRELAGGGNREIIHLDRITIIHPNLLLLSVIELNFTGSNGFSNVIDLTAKVERP